MSGYIGNILVPQATQTRDSFIATAGQTSFPTSGYTPNFLDVYLNGIKLHSSDFTATNGSDVVLATGASVNDVIEVVAYNAFDVASGTFDDLTVNNNIAVSGTVDGRDIAADGTKLDGIESGATGDQTNAEIRAAVEAATDSNVFTDADHTKLNAIEANATADQTASEIRTLVESATDSNVFTDADHTKLNAIESGATADQTKSDIDALNINADTLDGQHGSYYTGYADTAVANIVDSAPGTLDTLNELAAALGDDPNFATTVTNSIATKLPLAGGTLTGNLDVGGTVTADGLGVVSSGTNSQSLAEFSSASGLRAKIASDGGDDGYMYLYDANDANTVSFRTDGNHSFINGGGNFGIGTSSPTHTLHVNNSIRASSSLVSIDPTGSASAPALIFGGDDDSGLWRPASNTLAISTDGTEHLRIDSSGNVGIGTSSPSSNLHIKTSVDNSLTQGLIIERSANSDKGYINYQAGAFQIRATDGDPIAFGQVSNERMRIDSSGQVGIGTTSPNTDFEVRKGTTSAIRVSGGSNTNYKTEIGYDNSTGPYIKAGSSGIQSLQFYVDNTSLALTLASNRNATFTQSVTATTFHGDGSNLTGVGGSTTAGAVGTYAWAAFGTFGTGGIIDFGDTKAGSNIYPVSIGYDGHTGNSVAGSFLGGDHGALSGTWRFLGDAKSPAYNRMPAGLWVRIS